MPNSGFFAPKSLSTLREGYSLSRLRADAVAGLTVAIVALPLSMAIAIASHATPAAGLYTAIVGGFIISALGGSRFQIGGPAGAFIVLLASIVDQYGYDGLLLATMMAGVVIFAIGALRLGTYIKYVPHPVTVGFTAGIAVIIFASQIKDLLGLSLPGAEPAALIPKIIALWEARPTLNIEATGIAVLTIALIVILRKLKPHWPGFLIAVVLTAALVFFLKLDVQTIQSKFGGIPRSLPAPGLPAFSWEKFHALIPSALSIALLGSIESLLSAVVADSMTGRRHRSNTELMAQGIANIGSALFGGITATGTIARTATNIRAGGTSPVSGILHSLFVLLFMAVAAPLAGYIPLAALAGILAVVAWNMAEKAEFKSLLTSTRGDAAVLLATFGLTVFRDLTEGIVAGVTMGALLFMHRMAQATEVRTHHHTADSSEDAEADALLADKDIVVHHINGAFFFGAASTVAATLERIGDPPKGFILDMAQVPFVDYSAAHSLHGFLKVAHKHGAVVYLTGAPASVRRDLIKYGIRKPHVHYGHTIADCARAIRHGLEIDAQDE
ncbi:SulP family inorganic anion transporter [Aestuariivirga sp.]|uniref:SulP family inorganic anion transporter n=1 Tax=Aestuariivirga sp. TaxID=2650926 RepID=UPI0039E5B0BE